MTPIEIGMIALAAMGVLVLLGLYVPIALIVCSFGGVWAIKGSALLAGKMLAIAANEAVASYFFGVIPLFVMMGFIVSESGLGRDAFDVANTIFRRLRGGLGIGTVGANAIFAAITGVSIASAAVFTKIAVPQMVRHGYTPRFAVGVVAGSSVLGMLIPPSLLLILYGIITEQSIGDLFMAGVGPGLLLSAAFVTGIMLMARFWPSYVGRPDDTDIPALTFRELLAKSVPISALILLVLGGIYGGLFTPVEAGAMGSIGALAIGFMKRALDFGALRRILIETGLVTASVCFLIIAAQMYSRMLAFSGLPAGLASFATDADLSYLGLIAMYLLIVIALGMVLDSTSIMLIMVPLMMPVIVPMGVDLVWFGIVTLIAIEVGLLTPPFGLSVFVIKATLEDQSITLGDIFKGAAPFILIMLGVLAAVVAVPSIATGLVY
ncbi:TRAP transporter large permease [Antarctobacter sp.]|uniref:TRAP transporter large permease n=1 Tax=Antarctobacter sp. TaxID=1872577 RepID=UPI003A93A4C3